MLFRSGIGPIADGVLATTNIVASIFSDPAFSEALGPHRCFINVSTPFLLSDAVEILRPEQAVIEILEDTEFTPDVVARCRALKASGYTLAMDDYAGDYDALKPALNLIDIIKVDLPQINEKDLARIVRELPGKTLLAEKVETEEDFKRCQAEGFTLFQGYFFAKPSSVGEIRHDPNRLAVVSLLALLAQDAENSELEEEFKHHGSLVVRLLRLVNSAASGLSRPLDSIPQMLMVIGRNQLRIWLQMQAYLGTSSEDPASNPLLQLAAVRAKTMELLANHLGRSGQGEFVTGLISLFDVVLHLSREEVSRRLGLAKPIREALVHYAGPIGALLALAEAIEQDDPREIKRVFDAIPAIADADLMKISLLAHRWASSLGR